jgi:hypothetical protein
MAIEASDLKKIIDTDLADSAVKPFIDAGVAWAGNVLAEAPYPDVYKQLIATYLAAHLLTIRDPQVSSETIGQASADYQVKLGLGMDGSRFGQAAMDMDYLGYFRRLKDKVVQASLEVLPREE